MTEQDKIWIEKCKVDWNYTIMVDNDEVFVVQGDEVVHTFSEYGYYFIKYLLQYIGCDADFV